MKTERELLAERDALMTQARDLNALAETEPRDLSVEEQAAWDKLQADIQTLDSRIARARFVEAVPPQRPGVAPVVLRNPRGDTFASSLKSYLRMGIVPEGLRGLVLAVASFRRINLCKAHLMLGTCAVQNGEGVTIRNTDDLAGDGVGQGRSGERA